MATVGLFIIAVSPVAFYVVKSVAQRRGEYLSDKDLLPLEKDFGLNCHVVRSLTDVDRSALTAAFREDPDTHWIYNAGQPLTNEGEVEVSQHSAYYVDFAVNKAQAYGHIIKCVDKRSGEFQGCICLTPSVNPLLEFVYYVLIFFAVGIPPKGGIGNPGRIARFLAVLFSTIANEYIPNEPSWSVMTFGVAPNAQGRGVGTMLLKQINHLAATKNVSIQLQCRDGNVSFYSKRGYVLRNRWFIQPVGAILGHTAYPYNSLSFNPH